MSGMLYLCATPIGNLGDLSQRAMMTLQEVDLIAAEDTRNSIKLLNHFQIRTPMTSYHEHNKYEKAVELVAFMKEGKKIALISDAGTPGISDPGEVLVRMCHEEGLVVTSLPGPSACITALSVSGLSTARFCFEGFLPRTGKERRQRLAEASAESRTLIYYESPHHLVKTLQDMEAYFGADRQMALCRELTKKFETITKGTLSQMVAYHKEHDPRGEYVLVVAGIDVEAKQKEEQKSWQEYTLEEHMAIYEGKGILRKDAMKKVAEDRGTTKREVYQSLLKGIDK